MTEIEYLMVTMMEECAEIQQNVSKILRFGPGDRYPADAPMDNIQKLQIEMADLIGTVEMLEERGLKIRTMDMAMVKAIKAKKQKVLGFMVYARARGTLESNSVGLAGLTQAVSDFIHNVKTQNVAGMGDLDVKADASFRELVDQWNIFIRALPESEPCSNASSSTPGDTTPATGAPTST